MLVAPELALADLAGEIECIGVALAARAMALDLRDVLVDHRARIDLLQAELRLRHHRA
jgi:hypothetical protein